MQFMYTSKARRGQYIIELSQDGRIILDRERVQPYFTAAGVLMKTYYARILWADTDGVKLDYKPTTMAPGHMQSILDVYPRASDAYRALLEGGHDEYSPFFWRCMAFCLLPGTTHPEALEMAFRAEYGEEAAENYSVFLAVGSSPTSAEALTYARAQAPQEIGGIFGELFE